MAKAATIKVRLVCKEDPSYFYVTKINPKNMTEKLRMRKYHPKLRKHVEFVQEKMK